MVSKQDLDRLKKEAQEANSRYALARRQYKRESRERIASIIREANEQVLKDVKEAR